MWRLTLCGSVKKAYTSSLGALTLNCPSSFILVLSSPEIARSACGSLRLQGLDLASTRPVHRGREGPSEEDPGEMTFILNRAFRVLERMGLVPNEAFSLAE